MLNFRIGALPRRPRWRAGLAGRYFAAGSACALVLVVVMFVLNDIAFLPIRFGVTVATFVFTALLMALYIAGLRSVFIVAGALVWVALVYLVAPESAHILLYLGVPALMLSLLVGNPLLRRTTIPLFLVSVALVVLLTLSLDFLYNFMRSGILDRLAPYLSVPIVTWMYILLSAAVVLAVAGGLAWGAVRLVARLTAGSSEFMMQADVVWLFQTIWLVNLGWGTNGPVVLAYFLGFGAYRLVLMLLRPRGRATSIYLLLRVFGQRESQTQLARGLLLDWRQRGPILLIGAADLATETLDPPELAAFLSRRLSGIFISDPDDLEAAQDRGEARLSDGLFPMQDYYCRDNSWRPTILTLMSRARRVLVDMRGYNEVNAGIRYEIDALAARVPAARITILIESDKITQAQDLFRDAWARAERTGESGTVDILTA